MTDLRNQRRMAKDILKCGRNRVWMDPDRLEDIAKAVTKHDVRTLINGGAIEVLQKNGISNGRKKYNDNQKKKGRRRGIGSRKGKKYARLPRKERWIRTIRPLRTYLRELRDNKSIDPHIYRKYYRKAKGGEFRNKQYLKTKLVAEGILKEEKQ
jgi:large subunit ribosomal protein L19e